MTPEQHNQLRAHGLAVWVMDYLRSMHRQEEEVTLWTLNNAVCERYELSGSKRKAQYSTTRRVVMSLEAAGLIASRKEWDKATERYHKILWPC